MFRRRYSIGRWIGSCGREGRWRVEASRKGRKDRKGEENPLKLKEHLC